MQYFCSKIYFLFISFGIATYFNFANYDFRSDLKKFQFILRPHMFAPPPFQKFLDTPLNPTRLKPEIGSGSGLKTNFFSENF